MQTICVNGGGLDHLKIEKRPLPIPQPDEILVRWRATSLNFHDYLVATGGIQVAPERIPMSDGAGEVVEAGSAVAEWKMGDKVMSLFFPNWTDGKPTTAKTTAIVGESADGFMTEYSCVKANAVTAIP